MARVRHRQLTFDLDTVPQTPQPGEVEAWALSVDVYPLVGVDEAGRGPLAGPVVAGAVALPKDHSLLELDDSKRLTEATREALFDRIQKAATAFGIGIVDAKTIDRIGIAPATFKAMRQALKQAQIGMPEPALVVVDGRQTIPGISLPQRAVVKGDGRSWNVAAASILAKVTRDRMLVRYHKKYPEYGFDAHKGYGTKQHLAALAKLGPCPIHRRCFRPLADSQ